jgi:ATP/ADP translocase/HEAT repeat protein
VVKSFYKWLGLRQGELGKTAGMFLYLMMAVGAFITARIARDTLFLSRYDIAYLPYMYVWVAGVMAVLSYTYSHFADRFRRDRLVLVVTSILLAMTISARLMLSLVGEWFYPVLYVFVEVMGGLLLIQFWTFANDIFNTREAKRLFGLVGAGGVVATIGTGFAIGALARAIGTVNLLFISAGLLVGCLLVVETLRHKFKRELQQATNAGQEAISLSADLSKVFSSRHLKVIAWMVLLTFMVVTIVDYQFKVVARYTFLNQEDSLSSFFGLFFACAGVFSFLIQFLATGRLLQKAGIIICLLLLPVLLAGGSILLLVMPSLLAATLLKGSDTVLRYSINDATTQVLYLPVPGRIRGRAKAFIEGILKPMAQGISGLIIAWTASIVGFHVGWLGIGSLVVLIAWTVLVLGLKKEYVRSLLSTLRQRRLHFGRTSLSISDSQAIEALQQTMADTDESNILHALEMIPYVQQHDWSSELGRLLDHESANIRLQAIRLIERENCVSHMEQIMDRFSDPDERVRAEAVISYCTAMKEKSMGVVEPLLKDESVQVRAAAVVGLIRYSGLEGIVVSAEVLKDLVSSSEIEQRKAGAWAIGKVGVKTFYRSLLPLLNDSESSIRVEAIHAAAHLKSQELILPLVYCLADSYTVKAAVSALGAYGPVLITTLRTALDNPQEDPAIRQAIPKVLAKIGNQLCMDVLSNILDTDQTSLRSNALDAILQLHLEHTELRRDKEMLRRALHRELKEAFQLRVISNELLSLNHELLLDTLQHRFDKTIDRIFKLLRVLNPGKHLEAVYRNIFSPNTNIRANSIELLDNLLDSETRRCLLALLDEQDTASIAARGDELFPLMHLDAKNWLNELVVCDHKWTVVCALQTIGQLGDSQFEPVVRMMLNHASPLVRETAAFCLKNIVKPKNLTAMINSLHDDPNLTVRQAVSFLMATVSAE